MVLWLASISQRRASIAALALVYLTACALEPLPSGSAGAGGTGVEPYCADSASCGEGGQSSSVSAGGAPCVGGGCAYSPGAWRFEPVGLSAGLTAEHDWTPTGDLADAVVMTVSGGVAAGDFDDDGFVDLFSVGCADGTSALYRNVGDGTFTDVTAAWGVTAAPGCDAGPVIADFDGDGSDDLFIGGVAGARSRLFLQTDAGQLEDATASAGLDVLEGNVVGGALADVDLDGDLDLALGRWATHEALAEQLFRNDAGVFAPATAEAGLSSLSQMTFTPNFVDMDGDGLLDLLVASDFHTTMMYLAMPEGGFVDVTSPVITDENGMGVAIGDYDGDGDFDWFVSSVWDPNGLTEGGWGVSGNRLYENIGGGALIDATDAAGVREGFWGWGACFADFDNDGDLDLFHTNGYSFPQASEFENDPSVLYLSHGDGTFSEHAGELGIGDTAQGRGVVCFDYDRDGFVDVLVSRNRGPLELYRNNGARAGHYLGVALRAAPPNTRAIGARIEIVANGKTQIGLVRAGSNYASQDPAEVHFGVGDATTIDSITVRRPGGGVWTFGPTSADQRVVLQLE